MILHFCLLVPVFLLIRSICYGTGNLHAEILELAQLVMNLFLESMKLNIGLKFGSHCDCKVCKILLVIGVKTEVGVLIFDVNRSRIEMGFLNFGAG